MVTIPGINRVIEVSTGRRTYRRGCLARTTENLTDEISDESGLLERVRTVWDSWGVRVIGKWLFLRVSQGEEFWWRMGSKVEGFDCNGSLFVCARCRFSGNS